MQASSDLLNVPPSIVIFFAVETVQADPAVNCERRSKICTPVSRTVTRRMTKSRSPYIFSLSKPS